MQQDKRVYGRQPWHVNYILKFPSDEILNETAARIIAASLAKAPFQDPAPSAGAQYAGSSFQSSYLGRDWHDPDDVWHPSGQ